MKLDLALPLFALVARDKIDPATSDLGELAAHLGEHLERANGIVHEAVAIEGAGTSGSPTLYLVLLGVPRDSWPAFIALCEVQRAQPFAFRRDEDGERFSLHPLGTKKSEG